MSFKIGTETSIFHSLLFPRQVNYDLLRVRALEKHGKERQGKDLSLSGQFSVSVLLISDVPLINSFLT